MSLVWPGASLGMSGGSVSLVSSGASLGMSGGSVSLVWPGALITQDVWGVIGVARCITWDVWGWSGVPCETGLARGQTGNLLDPPLTIAQQLELLS